MLYSNSRLQLAGFHFTQPIECLRDIPCPDDTHELSHIELTSRDYDYASFLYFPVLEIFRLYGVINHFSGFECTAE